MLKNSFSKFISIIKDAFSGDSNSHFKVFDGFKYYVSQDETHIIIDGYIGKGGKVIVPSEIDNIPVTIIGKDAFEYFKKNLYITLPDTIVEIDSSAFCNCSGLKAINIPDSVKTIGEMAFSNASSLTEIEIPGTVSTLPYGVFMSCEDLRTVTLSPGITAVEENAFSKCEKLEKVIIPTTVGKIGDNKSCIFFEANKSVSIYDENGKSLIIDGFFIFKNSVIDYFGDDKDINIPAKIGKTPIIEISKGAFYHNKQIRAVTIENGIEKIDNYAFESCKALKKVAIPDSITCINDGAFCGCDNLESIVLPSFDINISIHAFPCCPVKTITDKNGNVVREHDKYFPLNGVIRSYFGDEEEVVIPSTIHGEEITAIGDAAFNEKQNIKKIVVPDTVNFIGEGAFAFNKRLISLKLPKNLKTVSRGMCIACTNLKELDIPDSVTEIVDYAFLECKNWESITLPKNLESVGLWSFAGCSISNLVIPNKVTKIPPSAFSNENLTSVKLPESLETIPSNMFRGCEKLLDITIPYSVTTIENYALSDCKSLETITLPSSITSFGYAVLTGCNKKLILRVAEGSAAEKYAKDNKLKYKYI